MNFHRYYPVDVVNGEGTRCTLFVAGCEHKCRGCYNKSTWNPDSGEVYTQALEDRIIADLNDTKIPRAGLSLSGGDPLHPANCAAILRLVMRVKSECPGKTVWVWSGYRRHQLDEQQAEIVRYCDVLIDGKYVEALRDPSLLWRGSANQQIHYL